MFDRIRRKQKKSEGKSRYAMRRLRAPYECVCVRVHRGCERKRDRAKGRRTSKRENMRQGERKKGGREKERELIASVNHPLTRRVGA